MIRFLGRTKDGEERVSVIDYSRETEGEHEFTFRKRRDDESMFEYFDRIMNEYWWQTGKNKRRYQDE